MTPQERRRVIELFEQCRETGSSIEETVEIIHKAMPHLTNTELEQFFLVYGEELKLDAAVDRAEAEAAHEIATILAEVQQTFGLEQANLAVAIPVLSERKEQGDKYAAKLLKRLNNAFENLNLSGQER
jgi:hypothetical protein